MAITISVAAVIVFLGLYAMGALDSHNASVVENKEYASGGFTFSGGLKDGLFSGYGAIKFQNKDSYIGGFSDGRFSGEGFYKQTGDTPEASWYFDGTFQNGEINGGTFYYDNGSKITYEYDPAAGTLISRTWKYSGGFNQRGQNGIGTFTFADGCVYSGNFSNGLADGEGTYTDAKGNTVYTGSFKNGLFDGQGIYYSPDGWSYEGNFKDGLFDGEGAVKHGDVIYRGVWEKGVQVKFNE